tara:strand:- start:4039 stop:4989 length:951 start_codon:yes stop_codon:yes gene_type:complete
MAEPIDYLKTYLNIDPMDYSAMEAQIAGEPLPEREVFTMPSYRPQVDLSQMQAMPMQPMAPTQPSSDSRLQSLMDEISALKSQIAELESAQATPVSDVPATRIVDELTQPKPDKTITTSPALPEGIAEGGRYYTGPNGERMYQPPMPKLGAGQFGTMVMPPAINLDTYKPLDFGGGKLTFGRDDLQNKMVGEPTKIFGQSRPTPKPISTTIAELQGQMQNIPQIPNAKSIGEAIRNLNLKFPKPQMLPNQLPVQVRADSSTTPYNVIQDQSLPSLPSRDVARNVLDTQMMFRPQQFAGGGSLDKALQNLKSQLSNG